MKTCDCSSQPESLVCCIEFRFGQRTITICVIVVEELSESFVPLCTRHVVRHDGGFWLVFFVLRLDSSTRVCLCGQCNEGGLVHGIHSHERAVHSGSELVVEFVGLRFELGNGAFPIPVLVKVRQHLLNGSVVVHIRSHFVLFAFRIRK